MAACAWWMRGSNTGITRYRRSADPCGTGFSLCGFAVYTSGIYHDMTRSSIAKLFQNGRSQAVRLPKEFRFEGDRVRVRRVGNGVLLEPLTSDVQEWFAEL